MIITYEFPTLGLSVEPERRDEISLEINHDQESIIDEPRSHVGINRLYFAREDVKRIMQAALNQPPGITEGVPFNIVIREGNQTHTVPLYMDLMDGFERSNNRLTGSFKMRQSMDWFDDKVDGFTYESMYNETGVQPFFIDSVQYSSYQEYMDKKCIYIPYVISSIPNWQDAFLALFGMTYIGNELYKTIKSLIQWATPMAGIGAVAAVLQLILEIAYAAILLITLIALIEQLIKCLIQPLKYHGAMLMSDLLKVTAVKLGLQAQSSIWNVAPYNQIAYLPDKYNPIEGNASSFSLLGNIVSGFGTSGYTSPAYAPASTHNSETANIQHGYFNGVGGDFLRLIKRFCNGKFIIPHSTDNLVLERRDNSPTTSTFQLKDIRQDWNGYNTDELVSNIHIKFQVDQNDRNSVSHISASGTPFYLGTRLQATHEQITTNDKALVLLKGLREIDLPVARGVAKDKLTFIEQAVKDIEYIWYQIANVTFEVAEDVINALIDVLNFTIIPLINTLIVVWNAIMSIIAAIINVINDIISAIVSLFGGSGPPDFNGQSLQLSLLPNIGHVNFTAPQPNDFSNRINALLLENDMVHIPKLLLVDTSRPEFTQSRIAYLHNNNASVINAKHLWDKFYSIDAFVGTINNRRTKISPALNTPDERNPTTLSLADFLTLASNRDFLDNYGEVAEADSVQWFPEQNGRAEFAFRKKGWLKDPQHPVASSRAEEIAINLNLKISVPNGQ